MEYFLIFMAGAILAALGFGLLKQEQRRSTRKINALRRLLDAIKADERAQNPN